MNYADSEKIRWLAHVCNFPKHRDGIKQRSDLGQGTRCNLAVINVDERKGRTIGAMQCKERKVSRHGLQ